VENRKNQKNFSEIGRRLKQARIACGFDRQSDFGRSLGGVPQTTLSSAERGDNLPSPAILVALAGNYINVNWLLTGRGEMFIRDALHPGPVHDPRYGPPPEGLTSMEFGHPPGAFVVREVVEAGYQEIDRGDERLKMPGRSYIPIVDRIAAGPAEDTTLADAFGPGDADTFLPHNGQAPQGCFALKVSGNSMEPKYRQRDLVLVDQHRQVESGEACILYRNALGERERVLKVLARKGRGVILRSLNPAFKPIELGPDRLIAALVIFGHVPFVKSRPGR
jgi:SOS-response transcriptional repressor LexA